MIRWFVVCLTFFPASLALANSAMLQETIIQNSNQTGTVGALSPIRAIEVVEESLKFDCGCEKGCCFEAVYTFRNTSDKDVVINSSFFGEVTSATQDGKDVIIPLSAKGKAKTADLAAAAAAAGQACRWESDRQRSGGEKTKTAPVRGLRFRVKKAAQAKIVVNGVSLAQKKIIEAPPVISVYGTPAPIARHPLLPLVLSESSSAVRICYDLWPIQTWKGDAPIAVEINLPSARADYKITAFEGESFQIPRKAPTGSGQAARLQLSSRNAQRLELSHREGRDVHLFTTGLLVAAGEKAQRAAIGVGLLGFVTLSGGADWAADDSYPFVSAEASLPNLLLFIPGLGVGVGGVRDQEGEVATRGIVSLQFPYVGIQWTNDDHLGSMFMLSLSI